LNESETFSKEIAIIYCNIAIILHYSDEYENARSNLYKALDMLNKNEYYLHSRCHYTLGLIAEKTNDLNCARTHFDYAIELAMQEKYPNHNMINKYTFWLKKVINKIENNVYFGF
jgi:tetratricopeptide (TPR) repeat protein